jgi:hypothetical protein
MPSRDGLDVYVSGDVFRVRVTDELWARAEAGAREDGSGREEVSSPMPGAVVGVPVAVGQRVDAGHTVAVVEAMKMQNDVTSARSGTVLEIRVKAGDVVDQGAVLVVLGPTEGGGWLGQGFPHRFRSRWKGYGWKSAGFDPFAIWEWGAALHLVSHPEMYRSARTMPVRGLRDAA